MAEEDQNKISQSAAETGKDNLTPLEAALRSHFEQYHPVSGETQENISRRKFTHRDSEHGFVGLSRLAGV